MQVWQYSDGALEFAINRLERKLEYGVSNPFISASQYASMCDELEELYDEQDLRRHDLYNVVRFKPYLEAKRVGRVA